MSPGSMMLARIQAARHAWGWSSDIAKPIKWSKHSECRSIKPSISRLANFANAELNAVVSILLIFCTFAT